MWTVLIKNTSDPLSLSSDICSFFNPTLVCNSCPQTPARSLSWSWNDIGPRRAASRWKISLMFAPECSFVLAAEKKKVTLRLFYQHEETASEGQPAHSVWIKKRRRQCSCDKVTNGCCWSISQITRGDVHAAGILLRRRRWWRPKTEIKGQLLEYLMKPILPSYFKYLQLQALNVEDGEATFWFLIHIFQRFRMSVHDFQIKAPPGPGRTDGSRLYQKVTAETSITSATQPSVSYPQLWPRDHDRKNEIVDANSGNEVFFDALLGAISWRPPPERCNYTSGWRRLQLLWLACSVPSILPAHFQLFSTAVFEFILESITIIPSV